MTGRCTDRSASLANAELEADYSKINNESKGSRGLGVAEVQELPCSLRLYYLPEGAPAGTHAAVIEKRCYGAHGGMQRSRPLYADIEVCTYSALTANW